MYEDQWRNFAYGVAQQYDPSTYNQWEAGQGVPGSWEEWSNKYAPVYNVPLPTFGEQATPEQTPTQGDGNNMLDFPTDVYPWSGSFSGLPGGFSQELANAVMPQVQNYMANPAQFTTDYLGGVQSSYANSLNNVLSSVIPQQVNSLANRGILSSTDGQNVIRDSISNTSTALMPSMMQNAAYAANSYGSNLGNLLSASNINTSYNEDKTQMYQILAQLLLGTM